MADRGTWPNIAGRWGTNALAGRADQVAFKNPHSPAAYAVGPCCSVTVSPSCVAAAMSKTAPDRGFKAQQRLNAEIADASRVYDSRLEKMCHESGLDPEPRRVALANGRTVVFIRRERGRTVAVHRIRPDEFE
jgi:hypothetical protein